MANSVGTIEAGGHSRLHIGNSYTTNYNDGEPKSKSCLADLRLTDPRDDKRRIEETKGGLFKGSYEWILGHENFQRWLEDPDSRLLWVKGDAGKGKTMLLCGIIDELVKRLQDTNDKAGLADDVLCLLESFSLDQSSPAPLSFFLCQGSDSALNHATAVIRGLMYLLLLQRPGLLSHIQSKYDHAGRQLFEDRNAFFALSNALTAMLHDPLSKGCFMVIDALDECEKDLPLLLKLIGRLKLSAISVKWIVSSRNRQDIEQHLGHDEERTRLSLELNADLVTHAIELYIKHKVSKLIQLKANKHLRDEVENIMIRKADGTFLWVALVMEELETVGIWQLKPTLDQTPQGLGPLYTQMLDRIHKLPLQTREYCRRVISTAAISYRPLHLCELGKFAGLPEPIFLHNDSVQAVTEMCGSFLTIRHNYVYLIHQSAKDFLHTEGSMDIFTSGTAEVHQSMFLTSLEILAATLKRDIFNLGHPGIPIDRIVAPNPNPLTPARYSCIYWIDHLHDSSSSGAILQQNHQCVGAVDRFMRTKFLYWVEALSLLESLPKAIRSLAKLEAGIQNERSVSSLTASVRDARRLVLYYYSAISNYPLQVYASVLVFSPASSVAATSFRHEQPTWIRSRPTMKDSWSGCLHTLEGHISGVDCLAFSPHGQLASAAWSLIKIWDVETGYCLQTLEAGNTPVVSMAFSYKGLLASISRYNRTITIWDVETGCRLRTLEGDGWNVFHIAFSPQGWLASKSDEGTIKIWDIESGCCSQTLEENCGSISCLACSSVGILAWAPGYGNIILWDVPAARLLRTLKDTRVTYSIAFSPHGWLASGAEDGTITIWDPTTGSCRIVLKGHTKPVTCVTFSAEGLLVSQSKDSTIKIWDQAGCRLQTLRHESFDGRLIAFSMSSRLLAAVKYDKIEIWEMVDLSQEMSKSHDEFRGHYYYEHLVAFSYEASRLASAYVLDKTIQIWNAVTGCHEHTLEGHDNGIDELHFSHNSMRLASSSTRSGGIVMIWDTMTGSCIQKLNFDMYGTTLSSDLTKLAKQSKKVIEIWDVTTGCLQQTLNRGRDQFLFEMVFSPDCSRLAASDLEDTAPRCGSVKIWDVREDCMQTFYLDYSGRCRLAFSPDSSRLALQTHDRHLQIWNASIGKRMSAFEMPDEFTISRFDSTGSYLHTSMGRVLVEPLSKPRPKSLTSSLNDAAPSALIKDYEIGFGATDISKDNAVTSRLYSRMGTILGEPLLHRWSKGSICTCFEKDAEEFAAIKDALYDVRRPKNNSANSLRNIRTDRVLGKPLPRPWSTSLTWSENNAPQSASLEGYGIGFDSTWITWNGQRVLWLPPEYRSKNSDTALLKIGIGCGSGRVLIFTFADGEAPFQCPLT